MNAAEDILAFWFEGDDRRALWFSKKPAFDAEIRSRYLETYRQGLAGKLEQWREAPHPCLALVILLDQFPRNMFRDDPRAFAGDGLALAAARHAVARGFDRALAPLERLFLYLPFEHSEDLDDQRRSLELFAALAPHPELAQAIRYAERHHHIIARFGRFPHRNRILGRPSSPEEEAFLKQPGSSF